VLSFSTGDRRMGCSSYWEAGTRKRCVWVLKTNVGREGTEGHDSLGEIGVVMKIKRLAC
jgi:hypothetical protein